VSDGVLILSGPTASGKTELAIALAEKYGAEIIGADSRQIYRGMPIGTAAPAPEQLERVPHHLIGFLDPTQQYSAARYATDALAAVGEIRRRGRRAIIVGGTGFYIRALLGGVVLAPQYDESLRRRLAAEARVHPAEFLHAWLERRDPQRARALHRSDTYRVLRALEVVLAEPRRSNALPSLASEGIGSLLVFLDVPLAETDRRIAERTESMLAAGLIEEAERVGASAVAANAVGYPQALAYLRGWSTRRELVAALERATRRYARRQRTWFRGEPAALRCAPELVNALVREKLAWSAKRG
jgi:tRNA dimethylallyltransferase